MSRVAITGASGLLGGNLAAELAAAGHQVVATRRGSTKVDHRLTAPSVRVFALSGDGRWAWRRGIRGIRLNALGSPG